MNTQSRSRSILSRLLVGVWIFWSFGVVTAQEKPAFDFTPFTGASRRTQLCDLNTLLVAGEVELKYALTGLNLTVGIIDHNLPEFMNFNEDGALDEENPGLFPNLLDELSRRAGFQWRNTFGQVMPPHHEINAESGVSWTDILVDAVETYDFSFGEWVHNLHRRQLGVGFPAGWFDASTILVQSSRFQRPEFHVLTFLKPFDNWVWGMIFVVIYFSAVIYWLLEKFVDGTKRCIQGSDIFFPAMAFTQHHMDWEPHSHSQRIFSFSLSFWALIMGTL